ncbi:zinc transporter ZIP1 [Plutella xylostella]|uniref:zinc transporter ZIP1 n=1 Tax=Plutella xylostella TaxID=51655 RepID=UPI0020324C6C|nr:zinc transporter ZIP1 [Plutella xylostella]
MTRAMDPNATMPADAHSGALHAKIVTMLCLFIVSMLCGCLPLMISLRKDWFSRARGDVRSAHRGVVALLAFGGGVLFATTFMHLLPEIADNVKLLQEAGELPALPVYLPALIMCCGFFMMYLIEELVHVYIHSRESRTNTNLTRVLSVKRNSEKGDHELPVTKEDSMGHGHSHFPVSVDDDSVVSALRGLLIVLALSVHELFEGLAVGLEASSANVWYMFGAVSAHKYIIAFCIGVELLAARTRAWLSVLYIFTFSFVSALGIGIGVLLVGGAGAADAGLYSVVLQGIACGTLVYVVFFEVWRQERAGLLQFSAALAGFTLMLVLEVIVGLVVEK